MLQDDFVDMLDALLAPTGALPDEGEEFRQPPLDILRYHRRPLRLSGLPILGRGLSVVATVRQPVDLSFSAPGYGTLLQRVAAAVHGRYPPWPRGVGASVGLTLVVATPDPIGPDEDVVLGQVLAQSRRSRVVPLALYRVNLGQEAMSLALAGGPQDLFPEPILIADDLTARFRRFVPLIDPSL